ncbi:MAG TPA: hypothetical protein VFZ66_06295 [Herpetosiphonaceae bacterium]
MDQPGQQTVVDEPHHVDHEFRDATPAGITMVGIGMLVMLVVTYLIVWGLFSYLSARRAQADQAPPLLATTPQAAQGPRLQVDPSQDLQQATAAEHELLTTYGWVDRATGVVRIPIDRALEMMAQPGRIPARPDGTVPFVIEEGHELESEGGQEAEGTPEPALEATVEPEVEATAEPTR